MIALDDLGSGLPFGNFVLGGREGLGEQGLPDGLQFPLVQESIDGRFQRAIVDCHSVGTSMQFKVTFNGVDLTCQSKGQSTQVILRSVNQVDSVDDLIQCYIMSTENILHFTYCKRIIIGVYDIWRKLLFE